MIYFFTSITQHTWKLTITCLVLYIIYWIKDRNEKHLIFKKLGINYVTPHLIYGSNHIIRGKKYLPVDVYLKWTKKFGKVYGYFTGARPTLVVSDLDMVRQILVKDFHAFVNRPKMTLNVQPVINTLVGLRDQRWKDVRSVLTPTFSMAKMKLMTNTMNSKVDEFLSIIKENNSNSQLTDWYSTYQGLTLDVISSCAFAMHTKCQRLQEKDELLSGVRSFLKNAINPAITFTLYFPFAGVIMTYITNYLAISGRVTQLIISNIKNVISKRRKFDIKLQTIDVLQLMLEAKKLKQSDKNTADNNMQNSCIRNEIVLSDDEIIANAWVFLLGGFETTANALSYTTYLLMQHPDIQDKVFEEIISNIPVSIK